MLYKAADAAPPTIRLALRGERALSCSLQRIMWVIGFLTCFSMCFLYVVTLNMHHHRHHQHGGGGGGAAAAWPAGAASSAAALRRVAKSSLDRGKSLLVDSVRDNTHGKLILNGNPADLLPSTFLKQQLLEEEKRQNAQLKSSNFNNHIKQSAAAAAAAAAGVAPLAKDKKKAADSAASSAPVSFAPLQGGGDGDDRFSVGYDKENPAPPGTTHDGTPPMNVVSMSLFSKDGEQQPPIYMTAGVIHNIQLAREVYPGWQVMVWLPHNAHPLFVEGLREAGAIVRLENFNPAKWMDGMFWRFYCLDLAAVDYCLVRDVDSRMNMREKRVVMDWMKRGTQFMTTHDSPMHNIDIVGCCFGGRAGVIQRLKHESVRQQSDAFPRKQSKGNDQGYLSSVVLPLIKQAKVWIDYDFRAGQDGKSVREVSVPWPGGNWDLQQSYAFPEDPSYFIGDAHQQNVDVNMTMDCTQAVEGEKKCPRVHRNWRETFKMLTNGKEPKFDLEKSIIVPLSQFKRT